ncbi:MAG: hypothetical protein ACR2QE_08995 [Acidimicrobiales bacterium]
MFARWALVGVLTLTACAAPSDIQADRIDVVAATCVSIIERRVGNNFDRDALADRAGPERLTEIYERFDGRRPAAVGILRRQCQIPPSGP